MPMPALFREESTLKGIVPMHAISDEGLGSKVFWKTTVYKLTGVALPIVKKCFKITEL